MAELSHSSLQYQVRFCVLLLWNSGAHLQSLKFFSDFSSTCLCRMAILSRRLAEGSCHGLFRESAVRGGGLAPSVLHTWHISKHQGKRERGEREKEGNCFVSTNSSVRAYLCSLVCSGSFRWVSRTQKFKSSSFAENPELSKVYAAKSGVSENTALLLCLLPGILSF